MKTDKVIIPTVEEIQAATIALNNLHGTMTFLRPLTPPERRQHGRMGTQTIRITEQRLEAARQHREQLPPAFDLRQFERSTALLTALHDCRSAAARMQSELSDTVLALGSDAVQSGRDVFAMIQLLAATANKMSRTANNLKKRPRAAHRQKGEPTAPIEQPPPAVASPAPNPSKPDEKAA